MKFQDDSSRNSCVDVVICLVIQWIGEGRVIDLVGGKVELICRQAAWGAELVFELLAQDRGLFQQGINIGLGVSPLGNIAIGQEIIGG